jgi:membrane glycosyltransferase
VILFYFIFFKKQSEALRILSLVPRQIVSTGGGVVVRPINWYTGSVDIEFCHLLLLCIILIYISIVFKSSVIVFYFKEIYEAGDHCLFRCTS